VRGEAGDWMISVQGYSESDDGGSFRDEPCNDIFNSSELRLAVFPAEQSRGQRAINQRPRRGDKATYQAELDAEAGWRIPEVVRLEFEVACREVALAPTED